MKVNIIKPKDMPKKGSKDMTAAMGMMGIDKMTGKSNKKKSNKKKIKKIEK